MLVVSRKVDQKIFITTPDGEVIEIILVDISGSQAKIGINASRDYVIERDNIKNKNK